MGCSWVVVAGRGLHARLQQAGPIINGIDRVVIVRVGISAAAPFARAIVFVRVPDEVVGGCVRASMDTVATVKLQRITVGAVLPTKGERIAHSVPDSGGRDALLKAAKYLALRTPTRAVSFIIQQGRAVQMVTERLVFAVAEAISQEFSRAALSCARTNHICSTYAITTIEAELLAVKMMTANPSAIADSIADEVDRSA